MPYGSRVVAAAGTPVPLFTVAELPRAAAGVWPARVSRIYIEALNSNTGFIYLGVSTLNKATGAGVIATLAAPAGGPAVFYFNFEQLAPGANNYRLQDYWIDAAVNGEGVLRTVWVA